MENKTQALKLRNCWILREKNRVRTSQGSAATVCRWGEQIYLGWMSKFHERLPWALIPNI